MASIDLRAAAQQALEALEMESNPTAVVEVAAGRWELKSDLAIAALRAALAEPQEPVAYSVGRTLHWHEGKGVSDAQLFAAPLQRLPLTEEEISEIASRLEQQGNTMRQFARAVERAHGIGGEG